MEKAKAAVSSFLNKDGQNDTTVHEKVAPAVQHETVSPTQHTETQHAVDREVHQDHHHTTVQPIQHQEVLPEKHTHQLGEVEHKHVQHGNNDHINKTLEAERAQFKNSRDVNETQHTSAMSPTVTGEHVHHHVHETIQPVVDKETIQPHIVHNTKQVHEVHHNEAKHHTASALPAMSMDEFQKAGGSIGGREERTDAFAGEPRTLAGESGHGTHGTHNGSGMHDTTGTHDKHATHDTNGKPSLMDKMNPKIDADGDGKAGFMK